MSRVSWLLLSLSVVTAEAVIAAPLNSRELDAIPLYTLSPAALEQARAALPVQRSRGPALMAIATPMEVGLADGRWSEEGSTSIWRVRLYSAGATLLVPTFDRFELPASAQLRVSDPEGRTVQGPYTHADRADDGSLSTALVPGQEVLLELRVDRAQRGQLDLRLGHLGHGVMPMTGDANRTKASGACNVDVVCPAGNPWREEIRASVLLQVPVSSRSTFICSGQLINNSSQDEAPLLLTATHCGINDRNASNVIVYYRFETSACGGNRDGQLTLNQNRTQLLFSHALSDHTLIRLERAPPAAANVFYAGFDASGNAPQSGVAVHHPQGGREDENDTRLNEKRISVFDRPATRVDRVRIVDLVVDAYRVFWSQGVTEGGSSGGGLWNQDHQLVGVLSGGGSSCTKQNDADFFGRMDVAWDAGLGNFLDPANTGSRSFCGTTPGTPCVPPANGGPGPGNGTAGGTGGGAFGAGLLLLLAGLCRRALRASPSHPENCFGRGSNLKLEQQVPGYRTVRTRQPRSV